MCEECRRETTPWKTLDEHVIYLLSDRNFVRPGKMRTSQRGRRWKTDAKIGTISLLFPRSKLLFHISYRKVIDFILSKIFRSCKMLRISIYASRRYLYFEYLSLLWNWLVAEGLETVRSFTYLLVLPNSRYFWKYIIFISDYLILHMYSNIIFFNGHSIVYWPLK